MLDIVDDTLDNVFYLKTEKLCYRRTKFSPILTLKDSNLYNFAQTLNLLTNFDLKPKIVPRSTLKHRKLQQEIDFFYLKTKILTKSDFFLTNKQKKEKKRKDYPNDTIDLLYRIGVEEVLCIPRDLPVRLTFTTSLLSLIVTLICSFNGPITFDYYSSIILFECIYE